MHNGILELHNGILELHNGILELQLCNYVTWFVLRVKFIGAGGGCDDEGAETFPAKENERTKTFLKKIEGVTG